MVLRKFYLCFIWPKLEYSSAVWCGCSRSDPVKLERLQIQSSRAITRDQDAARSLVLANLPTFLWRRRVHCLTLLWIVRQGLDPPKLRALLPLSAHERSSVALRSSYSLEVPAAPADSLLCFIIPLWNSLHPILCHLPLLLHFVLLCVSIFLMTSSV